MLGHNNNSSLLSDSMSVSKKSRQYKKSTYKNIKQTELKLKQIRRFEERSILPFSLKQQQHHQKVSSQQFQQSQDINNSHSQGLLEQSGLSQNMLKKFESRNAIGLNRNGEHFSQQQQRQAVDKNDKNHSRHESNKLQEKTQQQQHNISSHDSNLIMLQIHLTIAKKKYTLKVSNQITTYQLQSLIQAFLQQNCISNPQKKSHNKTKGAIMEMVSSKIKDGNNTEYKKLSKQIGQDKVKNNKVNNNDENDCNQQNYQYNITKDEKHIIAENKQNEKISPSSKISTQSRTHNNKHLRLQKSSLQQKRNQPSLIAQNDSINQDHRYQQDEQACSPSFKSSAYVQHKSPLKRTSHFSPEPKHQGNKYQKIVANYYNEKFIDQNDSQFKQNWGHRQQNDVQKSSKSSNKKLQSHHLPVSESPKFTQNHTKHQQTINISQNEFQQQKVKSVYQKWKQREKSKQVHGKLNDSQKLVNALRQKKVTDNSFVSQMSEEKKQEKREKNWNNGNSKNKIANSHKVSQRAIHSVSVHEPKQHEKRLPPKSPMNNKNFMNKQHSNMNKSSHGFKKSPSHHYQRNGTMIDDDYSPNKIMNRTHVFGSQHNGDNEGFQSNKYIRSVKEATERSVTPSKARVSTNLQKTSTNNQNQSKVYTIYDQDSYTIHEMSPDHFYKQGLVFEAKKKQQMEEKFKSLYPFTTRNIKDSYETQNGVSRNGTVRNGKESSEVSEKSKDKYFSSKLSVNKNTVTKSSANLHLDEKEKSTLHQRLYQDNKAKQTKITAVQANQRLIKISKPSQNQNQLKIMEENLKNIKGLSQQKKIKLIEKNIKIKEKIKEKDRIIDQELQKMIKQGKVKPTFHITQVGRSPFRKTQIF